MGRRGKKKPAVGPTPQKVFKINALKFPVSEKDDESVVCKLCGLECTYREFRIHNLEKHYNVSVVASEPTVSLVFNVY